MIEPLIERFGYVAVFLGTLLEGETFILLGGFLAHRGYMGFPAVVSAASLGAFGGDIFYFLLGRHFGRALLTRSRRAAERLPWLERFMERNHILWIFGVRYFYGIRWLAAALAGSSEIKLLRYATLALPACLVWAFIVGLIGYLAGEALERILGDLKRYEMFLLAALALVAVIYGLSLYWEERRLSRRRRQIKEKT